MTRIAIIDYESGNLRSVHKAFVAVAGDADVVVTNNPNDLKQASHVVFPGVGAFGDCYQGLQRLDGMADALHDFIFTEKKPFLGICVGMQLLATKGSEDGEHQGLGWVGGVVQRLTPADKTLKIPHMGWNTLDIKQPHPLFTGLPEQPHFYFVHSYHFVPENPAVVLSTTNYDTPFVSAIGVNNIVATQFHPEKSQGNGLKLLTNFVEWRP